MFDAVLANKASFSRPLEDAQKQPREDLVTSALFGTIRFLTLAGQAKALTALLGEDVESSALQDIYLWPRLQSDREESEPDVVIRFQGDSYWVVEVKWGAPLNDDQVGREIRSVQEGHCLKDMLPDRQRNVIGYTLLGMLDRHRTHMDDARHNMEEEIRFLEVRWPELPDRLDTLARTCDDPGLKAWANLAADFIRNQPEGRVLGPWPDLQVPPPMFFCFDTNEFFALPSCLVAVPESLFEFTRNI